MNIGTSEHQQLDLGQTEFQAAVVGVSVGLSLHRSFSAPTTEFRTDYVIDGNYRSIDLQIDISVNNVVGV